MKSSIKIVNGLKINDLVMVEGNIFRVYYFPTRSMVCIRLVHEMTPTAPQSIKMPRRNLDTDFNDMCRTFLLQGACIAEIGNIMCIM